MIKKTISIFGSTGSIGKNVVEVIKNASKNFSQENFDQRIFAQRIFEVVALVAKNDVKTLIEQALLLKPLYVIIENEELFSQLKSAIENLPKSVLPKCRILCGREAVLEIAKLPCDLFISAMVGMAATLPTLNAIKAGSDIALANKESLVCAGEFLMQEAKKRQVKIIPVDSEHNAIFQIFENKNPEMINNIVLTASGGPFFNSQKDFSKISVAEALKHPNWKMGAKISIDSATMMNKGLEMIEAFHLFPVAKSQIKIVLHPQSIVHGMVSYADGSTLAVLGLPDMKVPIAYALAFPQRMKIKYCELDLIKIQKLEFFAPDEKKFPAIKICRDVLKAGGSFPVVLNAANEIAVEKFLNSEISFDKITTIVLKTLEKISCQTIKSIEEILQFDQEARKVARNFR